MNVFIFNLLLGLGWCALFGNFTLETFATGMIVAFFSLWVLRPLHGSTAYFARVWGICRLISFFLWELLLSSLEVARIVITPKLTVTPAIVRIPLESLNDTEIMMLANLISLTPGSLSLDVSEDRTALYVHVMSVDDPDAVRTEIKHGITRRLLQVIR